MHQEHKCRNNHGPADPREIQPQKALAAHAGGRSFKRGLVSGCTEAKACGRLEAKHKPGEQAIRMAGGVALLNESGEQF